MTKFFTEDVNKELDKSGSAFYELEQGQNEVRIVSDFVWGYKYDYANRAEAKEKKYPFYPVGSKEAKELSHKLTLVAAMVLFDYKSGDLKSFNIHQKKILNPMRAYVENDKYGDLTGYDIVISKTGEGRDVEYSVIANPPEAMGKEVKEALEGTTIKMDNVFNSESPIIREE